jgi:hypothetical protein
MLPHIIFDITTLLTCSSDAGHAFRRIYGDSR